MKTYAKFGLLVAAIIGVLAWLAAGGVNDSKTYYKTISELNQMGYRYARFEQPGCIACGLCFYCCPEFGCITVYKKN